MNIDVITSFNQSYYDRIGRHSVDSWLQYWPQSLRLTCYVEQCAMAQNQRIIEIDFKELDQDYQYFQQDPALKSRVKTFAKKAWSFMHAAATSAADRIIWIDADVITQRPLTVEFLHSLLPDHVLSTHLGVTYLDDKRGRPGPWLVPETGFFAINTRHEKFHFFRSEYVRRYVQRDQSDLRRFYDNDVYGAALQSADAAVLDLCAGLKKPYRTPMKHTVLGPYLHHYKAQHSKESFQTDCQ